jgi:hypothetical protein
MARQVVVKQSLVIVNKGDALNHGIALQDRAFAITRGNMYKYKAFLPIL